MSVEELFNNSLPEGGTQLKQTSTSHLISFLLGAAATDISSHIIVLLFSLKGEEWFKADLELVPLF